MKFSVKLIAAALCAAMLCVPALAAASATGAGAYVPNPQYTVISGTVAHQKDGGLLMSTSTGEPTEDYILWTEGVMILDAVQRRAGRCKVHQGRQHRLCVAGGADCHDHAACPRRSHRSFFW